MSQDDLRNVKAVPSRAGARGQAGDLPLVALLNILLRNRLLLFGLPLVLVALTIVHSSIADRTYTATSKFSLAGSSGTQTSNLGGLARQLGVDLGGGSESLEFYVEFLRSRDILWNVVRSEYHVPIGGPRPDSVSGTLMDLYEIDAETPIARLRAAENRLRRNINVNSNSSAGLIELETTARWASLGEAINRNLLQLLNDYNLERRQSRARAERDFVGRRMESAEVELKQAEAALESFLEQNRRYRESPQLSFEAARLERRVQLRQDVFSSLAQRYEQARIEEVRDMPIISIIQTPENSARPDGRGIPVKVVLAAILGSMLSMGVIFTREYFARQRARHPEEFKELDSLRRSVKRKLTPKRLSSALSKRANGDSDAVVAEGDEVAASERSGRRSVSVPSAH